MALDLLAMAESGLLRTVIGEWEISHDTSTVVWGRAVVKGLKDGVILTDSALRCTFGFRCHRPRPKPEDVYASAITIEWGPNANADSYATLESVETDCLIWRLPPLEDGSPGSFTVWRKLDNKASEALEVKQERAKAAEQLADIRAKAALELEEEREKAAQQLADARSKAAAELAGLQEKAAAEIAEERVKAASREEETDARVKAALLEVKDAHEKMEVSKELAEVRARVADEIADENESLRIELSKENATCKSLKEQLQSLRKLVMEMMAQSLPGKAQLLKELVGEKACHHTKSVRQQDTTPDKELPLDKKRRVDGSWATALASCGA